MGIGVGEGKSGIEKTKQKRLELFQAEGRVKVGDGAVVMSLCLQLGGQMGWRTIESEAGRSWRP